MSSVVVVGTQWGDLGKGKPTDFLSENALARATKVATMPVTPFSLAARPFVTPFLSGIFSPDKISVIGNGVVNPKSIVEELAYLHGEGVSNR